MVLPYTIFYGFNLNGYGDSIKADKEKMHHYLHNSLKEACVKLGFLTAEKFDKVFHPEEMINQK